MGMEAMVTPFPLVFLAQGLVYLIEILFGVMHLLEVVVNEVKPGMKKVKC